MSPRIPKTNVYIDGFNLYNGSVKNTPFKWLDLAAMCSTLLPGRRINKIRYFTARVLAFDHDPQAPLRQDIYLRALRTIPNIIVHKGWFAARPTLLPKYPLIYPRSNRPPQLVKVLRMEEKRTDVNIATYLLVDCFLDDFDEAVVISNDADLALPIEIVRTQFGKTIGIINPHPKTKISGDMIKAATFHLRSINKKVLATSQFHPSLTDAKGNFTKPASW